MVKWFVFPQYQFTKYPRVILKMMPFWVWYGSKILDINEQKKLPTAQWLRDSLHHLLQITPVEISCLQDWSCQNKSDRLEVYLPGDWFRLSNVVSLCALYNTAHLSALFSPFFHLSAYVFSLMFSICFSVYPLLEASLGWLNDICLLETGDEMNIREIAIQEKYYLCNLKKKKKSLTFQNKMLNYFGQIVYDRVPTPPNRMNMLCKIIQTILEWFIKDNTHLSVWQMTGLFPVCYLVFPGAPYTCSWEKWYVVPTVGD